MVSLICLLLSGPFNIVIIMILSTVLFFVTGENENNNLNINTGSYQFNQSSFPWNRVNRASLGSFLDLPQGVVHITCPHYLVFLLKLMRKIFMVAITRALFLDFTVGVCFFP